MQSVSVPRTHSVKPTAPPVRTVSKAGQIEHPCRARRSPSKLASYDVDWLCNTPCNGSHNQESAITETHNRMEGRGGGCGKSLTCDFILSRIHLSPDCLSTSPLNQSPISKTPVNTSVANWTTQPTSQKSAKTTMSSSHLPLLFTIPPSNRHEFLLIDTSAKISLKALNKQITSLVAQSPNCAECTFLIITSSLPLMSFSFPLPL